MTTKQWLQRAWGIEDEINTLLATKEIIRQSLLSTTAKLGGDPVQSTKDPHKYDRLAIIIGTIDGLIDKRYDTENEIIEAIGRLEKPLHRRIMLLRYIDRMTFPLIAEEINMSQRHVERLHGMALIEMGGILNGRY